LKFTDLLTQRKASKQSWDRLNTNRTRDWDLYGFDIGLHPLNMAIGGIIPTRVTVIGARSGTGKTALTAPMFDATLRRKVDGSRLEYLFFTWELDPTLVIDRSICSGVGLTLRQLNQGAKLLSDHTMSLIQGAYEVTSKYPITYHTYSTDINEVTRISKEFVERCKEKSKIEGVYVHPVICIDYLNMAQFESAGLRTYGIADFMNGLKQFCNHEQASAVVFAQLSRETDKQNKIPDRSDFSDSSAIENAADNLIIMYRPEHHKLSTVLNPETGIEEDSTGKMLIRVLKGRDYGTGDFLIRCDIKHFRFWDYNHKFNHEYWNDYIQEAFWMEEFGLNNKVKEIQEDILFN
jgi:replicative DNA helicase